VTTGSVTLNCLETPPQTTLTLEQAYVYGCPAPFAQFIESAGVDAVAEVLELFHFDDPVTLPGFANDVPPRPEATAQPSPTAAPTADDEPLRRADALGQGELTVSPLHMAAVTAAVVNGGNAPQPRALLQIKPPGDDWTPVQERQPSLPITTVQNARQMQNIMRQSVQQGTAQAANREGYAIGGQVALAYSGESTQAWFVGWALTGAQRGVAVAIVLEDSDDLARAAHIGGTALKAAVDTLPIAIGTN
jgi:cell division protein FtsI/penicillin-binding protein 2